MTSSTRASEFVTDTMGLVLRIEQRRLPPPVKAIFDAVESGNATVYVPTMVFKVRPLLALLWSLRSQDRSLGRWPLAWEGKGATRPLPTQWQGGVPRHSTSRPQSPPYV